MVRANQETERMRTRYLSLFVSALAATGCIDGSEIDDPAPEEEEADGSDVDSYLLGLPELEIAPAQPKTEIECADDCPAPTQDGDFYCSYARYTETSQFDEFVAFQPNSATLWPGTVVRGEDAANGLLTPIGVDLAPVVFSVSLENISTSPVATMEDPSLSAFREARNEILSQGVTGATPAALDFEVIEVNSESQLSVALGADVHWPGGPDVAASFSFDSSEQKTKILVNFTQAYYTVDVDTPTSPAKFFADGTTVEQLEPWMGDASPPLYVQSITYGRRVIFSIQTERSSSEIKAALEASYSAGLAGGGVSISTEHKEALSESTIRAFVLGGSGDDATGAINGFEGLVEYIQNGGSYSKDSPGAPIAYKLAYLDNAVTKLAFTTDYAERTCTKNKTDLRIELGGIDHVGGGDPGGNIEIFGNIRVRYPVPGNRVEDCNTGGEVAYLWKLEDGSWISFPEMTTWLPPSATYIDLNGVAVDETQQICLIGDFWEEDGSTGEGSTEDDFGVAGKMISFADGWAGTHHVVTHGDNDNSLDVELKIDMQ
jgi:thiol-activated cytolysin